MRSLISYPILQHSERDWHRKMLTRAAQGEAHLSTLMATDSPSFERITQHVRERYGPLDQALNDVGAVATLMTETGREVVVATAVRRQFLPLLDNRAIRGVRHGGHELVGFDLSRQAALLSDPVDWAPAIRELLDEAVESVRQQCRYCRKAWLVERPALEILTQSRANAITLLGLIP
jgi:hypothetical protein